MYQKRKKRKKIIISISAILLILIFSIAAISQHIKTLEEPNILGSYRGNDSSLSGQSVEAVRDFGAEAIIVPGAAVLSGNTPSPILKARLDAAFDLYSRGLAPKILLSGDGTGDYYDEISVMLEYMKEKGVPGDDVFCDYQGINTYQSMVRAKQVFGVNRAIVVTQSFHLPRAIYIGQNADMKTRGIATDQVGPKEIRQDNVQLIFREIMARNKDFFALKFKKIPKYNGETVDISGDGTLTHKKVDMP
ncbi:MAG: ElyC/SanA/YdcF family protein [Clostridiales bacterium]|nr:YdcF family protein [Clostridiales bacterium]MDD7347361.1 ElyC/SanA/YdcF family protein [Clostridiales bacterium]MDY4060210.1 ElyC/SanA/YdcF family protein [Anaerovoracaceae bacterium]